MADNNSSFELNRLHGDPDQHAVDAKTVELVKQFGGSPATEMAGLKLQMLAKEVRTDAHETIENNAEHLAAWLSEKNPEFAMVLGSELKEATGFELHELPAWVIARAAPQILATEDAWNEAGNKHKERLNKSVFKEADVAHTQFPDDSVAFDVPASDEQAA